MNIIIISRQGHKTGTLNTVIKLIIELVYVDFKELLTVPILLKNSRNNFSEKIKILFLGWKL